MIQLQLPGVVCQENAKRPWNNRCPLSFATRCPQASWVSEFYDRLNKEAMTAKPRKRQRTAVYVGCNKGMDAINTLRMLSNNPAVDKFEWRDVFFENQTVAAGHCNQEFEPQYDIAAESAGTVKTIVHCLEAMPVTARQLASTVRRLQLDDVLLVKNAAVSDSDGWTLFPNQEKVGVEGLGLDACSGRQVDYSACSNVTVATLDSLLLQDKEDEREDPLYVDLLSIDVEGHDFNVLLGAKRLLPNVRYLEFGKLQHNCYTIVRA
jgi:FkbM family methyltransferase